MVDEFDHEYLAIDVAGSIGSGHVIDVLTHLTSAHSTPAYLHSNGGPEFVSNAILQWLTDAPIETTIIDPASRGRTAPTSPSTASSATSA